MLYFKDVHVMLLYLTYHVIIFLSVFQKDHIKQVTSLVIGVWLFKWSFENDRPKVTMIRDLGLGGAQEKLWNLRIPCQDRLSWFHDLTILRRSHQGIWRSWSLVSSKLWVRSRSLVIIAMLLMLVQSLTVRQNRWDLNDAQIMSIFRHFFSVFEQKFERGYWDEFHGHWTATCS